MAKDIKQTYREDIGSIAPSPDKVRENAQAIVASHLRLNGRLKTKTAIELGRWANHKTGVKVMSLHELREMYNSMFDAFKDEKSFDELHQMLGSFTFETYMFIKHYIREEIIQKENISE